MVAVTLRAAASARGRCRTAARASPRRPRRPSLQRGDTERKAAAAIGGDGGGDGGDEEGEEAARDGGGAGGGR